MSNSHIPTASRQTPEEGALEVSEAGFDELTPRDYVAIDEFVSWLESFEGLDIQPSRRIVVRERLEKMVLGSKRSAISKQKSWETLNQ